ncbi:MAG TPA: PHP domain-containing protein [Planctomycetota bacterium]|nr:PHP domain-containing protein [Planctomycetota bacterium]
MAKASAKNAPNMVADPVRVKPCIDFHFHSVYSNDAFGAPGRYIALAAASQVVAIAPTEHDNTDSLAVYVREAAAQKAALKIYSGVEIDTLSDRWGHFHMLAFFFDPAHAGLQAILQREVAGGMTRLEAVAERMRAAGEKIDLPAAYELYRQPNPGRAVGPKALWHWLQATGRTDTLEAAKDLYNKFGQAVPVDHRSTDIQVVIDTVHAAGGVTILAHPARDYTEADIDAMVRLGLDGVEVFHMAKVEYMNLWRSVCQRKGLPMTGGSDNHGVVGPDQNPWPTYAPAHLLEPLFKAAEKRHGKTPQPLYDGLAR